MAVPLATSPVLDWVLVVAIAGVLVAPIAGRVVRRRFDPFEPIVLAVLAYGVMFVVRPAAMIADDARVFVGPRETLDVSATFTETLLLALLGAVSLVVGYEFVGRPSPAALGDVGKRASALPRWSAPRSRLPASASSRWPPS